MTEKPTTIVIFGASGDLTERKLIPALFNNYKKGRLPENFYIVGYARRDWDDDFFRDHLRQGMDEFAPDYFVKEQWETFAPRISYFQGDLTTAEDFPKLKTYLQEIEGEDADRIYYLATAPNFFTPVAEHLGAATMNDETVGWRRLVVEKPFGTDLASARALSEALHPIFAEEQIYRIDHYLGKETAQNILFFRFANILFESVWNRNYIDNVQITVTESVDVGRRAGYYDEAGVLRDMVQNHLMQLLALTAMEPPTSFAAKAVRDEKAKLFGAIRPITPDDVVLAQYEGYLDLEGVAEGSRTPTYTALKLNIDNWRWKGVPFYLRSGKALAKKNTEIIIEFEQPPHLMFDTPNNGDFSPNVLSICVQPDEGIHLQFEAKVPDSEQDMRSVHMEFHYRDSFAAEGMPDAYERLLLDAIQGDAALFTRRDGIEQAWKLVDPLIQSYESGEADIVTYQPDSWGPEAADLLLTRDGRQWQHGCSHTETGLHVD